MDTTGIAFGLIAVLALVFANGFFVAAEFSLVTVRKTRIDQLIAEGHRGARTVRRALNDPDSYIAATQLGITMASLALGWVGEPALAKAVRAGVCGSSATDLAVGMAHTVSVVLSFAIITALHIVLGELAPKTVALQQSEMVSLLVAKPTELFMRVFWIPILMLNGLGNIVVRSFGLKPPSGHSLVHSEEELKMLVTASQEAGVLEEEEEQMLHRVFAFSDLTAGQIMVPRTEMVALAVDTPAAEVAEIAARGGHARLPVYRKSIDDIIGILNITDLFHLVAKGQPPADLSGVVARGLHGAGDADGRRPAVGDAPPGLGDRDCHRRVRRNGRPGDVCRADGAHRRRTWRRRADHACWPTARRSSTGWRWWPTSTRSSGCTSTRSRTTRWADTCWGGWAAARAWATASTSRAARCASRRSMACASRAFTSRREERTAGRRCPELGRDGREAALRRQVVRSRRNPLATTTNDVPVSARIASHNDV